MASNWIAFGPVAIALVATLGCSQRQTLSPPRSAPTWSEATKDTQAKWASAVFRRAQQMQRGPNDAELIADTAVDLSTAERQQLIISLYRDGYPPAYVDTYVPSVERKIRAHVIKCVLTEWPEHQRTGREDVQPATKSQERH